MESSMNGMQLKIDDLEEQNEILAEENGILKSELDEMKERRQFRFLYHKN